MKENDRETSHPPLTIVGGTPGFDDITSMLVREAIRTIERYQLENPKRSGKLLEEMRLRIERHYHPEVIAYVDKRLNEQIDRYIELGFADCAGYTPDAFRRELQPLIDSVHHFFVPPALHPIQAGEFTLLLVIPTTLVPLRRQIMSLRSLSGQTPDLSGTLHELLKCVEFETTKHGKTPPKEPYVLVGINGGRGLKGNSILVADKAVAERRTSYFAVHELIQLLLVRPKFLPQHSEAIPLGAKCAGGYLRFTARDGNIDIDATGVLDERFGEGIGKPYYAHMVTA